MLDVRSISKHFGALQALDDVSFQVGRGQVVGFLGPNGAGKTTAMRAILGLLAVDAGAVTWRDEPVDARMRMRVGYMPAERGLYPSMKVHEHVAYFASLAGLDDRAADAAATRWLGMVGLDDRAGTKVQDLSSGNQQRVQLAVALVHEPELLVLDEPFSGLDPVAVASLEEILVERVADGVAVLFSSHQLDVVEKLTRDVVIIDHGRVVLWGDVDELRSGSALRYVAATFATSPAEGWQPPGDLVERRGRRVRCRVESDADERQLFDAFAVGGELTSFGWAPPALSEVFLEAVGRTSVEGPS